MSSAATAAPWELKPLAPNLGVEGTLEVLDTWSVLKEGLKGKFYVLCHFLIDFNRAFLNRVVFHSFIYLCKKFCFVDLYHCFIEFYRPLKCFFEHCFWILF